MTRVHTSVPREMNHKEGFSEKRRPKLVLATDERAFVCRWNQLDLAIVLLSIMGITLEEIEVNASLPINPTIIRIMRVLRIARGMIPLPFPLLIRPPHPSVRLTTRFACGAACLRCLVKQPRPWDSPICHFCTAHLGRVQAECEPARWHRETQSALRKIQGESRRVRKHSQGRGGEPRHIMTESELSRKEPGLSMEGEERGKGNKKEEAGMMNNF